MMINMAYWLIGLICGMLIGAALENHFTNLKQKESNIQWHTNIYYTHE